MQRVRVTLIKMAESADSLGIFLGFLANLLVVMYVKNTASAWRILTNTVLIPTVPLLIMIYLMPESPRYLMKHGNYCKALEAFEQVQTTRLLASRDFMYAHAQLDFESRLLKGEMNQLGNLAERVDLSALSLSGEPSSTTPNRIQLETIASQRPIPPGRSIQDSHLEATNMVTTTISSNSQRQTMPQAEQRGNSNIELATLNRQWSDISSLNFDVGVKRAKKKNNPYSYNIGVNGYYKRLSELWTNKRCRRALLCASVSMITQTLTGVNTIAFLGTIVWKNAIETNSDRTAAIIGLAFGAANYIFGLPAYWSSDRLGRSIMLLLGLPNMAWSILVFALLFKIPESDSSVRTPMIGVFAVIFVAFYAPTAGTSPFSIAAEVFPLVSREAGMAVSVAVNLLGAGVLVLVFPFLLNSIRPTAAFSIFAGLNLVAFVLVYLFVPETRMRTLEELQYTFDLPTGWHIAYRVGYIRQHVWANWWKYLTRKEVEPPIPFYEWARETYREMEDAS
jgi:MFS family permease